ncbi:hypothetical protein E4U35_001338 [Claviceps purpurea]|nr:hypothetical protein E4U35_001338 [Claviceps purpurea]
MFARSHCFALRKNYRAAWNLDVAQNLLSNLADVPITAPSFDSFGRYLSFRQKPPRPILRRHGRNGAIEHHLQRIGCEIQIEEEALYNVRSGFGPRGRIVTMRIPQAALRRQSHVVPTSAGPRFISVRSFGHQTKFTCVRSRPSLPFLFVPTARPSVARSFTSERTPWLKNEAKLFARYTLTIWAVGACLAVAYFFINEEFNEREHPTPHEWSFMTRKYLRDALELQNPRDGMLDWARCLELAREVVIRLDDSKASGSKVVKLSEKEDPALEVPGEFINRDISAMSEEWRRGYFEALMLAAKAAEHVDGWMRDTERNIVWAPEFVRGPSNPRPRPVPRGQPHAPREEVCELAFPSADHWYTKALTTVGLTSRQRMEVALEYATFLEFKHRPGVDALYELALTEASGRLEPSKLPYDSKTLVLKNNPSGPAPSLNVLDTLTVIANHKARKGDTSSALPMYISLLQARRSLPTTPPPQTNKKSSQSLYETFVTTFGPPAYPPPGPDGTSPPWRDAHERCQEASLSLYIGEILYATCASKDEGVGWTRDGVDLAEEQLRALDTPITTENKDANRVCRECLATGLENWSVMVSRLAREEDARKSTGASTSGSLFSFWGGGSPDAEGRWAAEEAVVLERTRRTSALLEDAPAPSGMVGSLFQGLR